MTEIICAGLSALALIVMDAINKRDKESKQIYKELDGRAST